MESPDIIQNVVLNYKTNADDTGVEVDALAASVESVTDSQAKNDVQTKKQTEGLKTFKTQLREANQEMMKAAQTYGETSKEAVIAAKKVADLKDQMQFSKDLVDKFNPDQKFKALGAATQIAATATSGLVSGMALFGDQSADTEKALLKVQAAMAFSQAISGLSDLGDQWKTLKTVVGSSTIVTSANTAATTVASIAVKLFGGAVDSTSKSFKFLKGAIIGTGIGALVIGVTALIQNWSSLKESMSKIGWLQSIADTIGSITNAVTDFLGVTSEVSRAQDRLKSEAAASNKLNEKFLAEHGDQLDKYTQQKIEAKKRYNDEIEKGNYDQKELAKRLNRELAAIEYSRGDESRKIAKENAEKAEEKRKERLEKAKEQAKKEAEAEQDRIRKQAEAAREEYESAQKIVSDAKKENEQSLLTEQELAIEKENEIYATKLEAAKKANLDLEQLEIEHLNNINDINLAHQNVILENTESSADEEKKIEQDKRDAKIALATDTVNSLSAINQTLLSKSKAGVAVQKALALTQIGLDSATAFSHATPMAIKAGEEAAKVAGPAAPIVGPIATAISYASSAATIASNVMRAKAILSGGGGSSSSGGASSGGQVATSAAPQVSFQASSENQIATSIATSKEKVAPIEAYVVESTITDAQYLAKKRLSANSF